MNYLIIPVVLALVFKLSLVVISSNYNVGNNRLYVFIGSSIMHNLSELLLFVSGFDSVYAAELLMKIYYVMSISTLALGISLILYITKLEKFFYFKISGRAVYGVAISLSLLALFSKEIIAGAEIRQYSITADKGDFYWLFQVYSLICLMLTTLFLLSGIFKSRANIEKTRCIWLAVAYAPNLIAATSILTIMALGVSINAVAVFPITGTFFLYCLFFSERSYELKIINKNAPDIKEGAFLQNISNISRTFLSGSASLPQTQKEIERLLVLYAYEKHDGNVYRSSKEFGIGRPSFYAKLKRFGVDLSKNRDDKTGAQTE